MTGPTLPKLGRIAIEDGEIIARRDSDGAICGRYYVGPDGLEYEGELTIVQVDDPGKLRFKLVLKDETRGSIGGLSFCVARPDGRGEEVAYALGSMAEDAAPGSLRGQFEIYIRRVTQEQPSPAFVLTSAYAGELFSAGVRRLYALVPRMLSHLWKFETPEDRHTSEDEPIPPVAPPGPPPLITPEERAERWLDVMAMQQEWPGMDLNNVESYLQGRSSPREFHDENANRAKFHEPTLHRAGRPY